MELVIAILGLVLALLAGIATTWLVIRLRARTIRRDALRTGSFLGPWRWGAWRGAAISRRPRGRSRAPTREV